MTSEHTPCRECLEQARLLSMSAEREAALLGKVQRLESMLSIVLACWCAGISPADERDIRDKALSLISKDT